ncbi:MAG: LemA family protein [Candidatus Eisenbacteria bacterium]|nr:LemA family protein [Candidatus Eisenbacteria bacterium]MCC7140764.1 LemA family protein [Candidatus Eisenbacteria bacterium]
MKKLLPLIIVLGLLLMVGGWLSGQYNGMVRSDQGVKAAWSQVENVLQRRFDLIPNLVETVKGYASHERETLEAVTNARSRVAGAGSVDDKITANNELSSALSRLLVVVEQYPDLKANQGFINLQDELAGTENRISVERGRYNEAAKTYNVQVKSFPTVLIANMMGFKEAKLFEAAAGAAQAPKVDFSK